MASQKPTAHWHAESRVSGETGAAGRPCIMKTLSLKDTELGLFLGGTLYGWHHFRGPHALTHTHMLPEFVKLSFVCLYPNRKATPAERHPDKRPPQLLACPLQMKQNHG